MAMIAMTTNSSINVNPLRLLRSSKRFRSSSGGCARIAGNLSLLPCRRGNDINSSLTKYRTLSRKHLKVGAILSSLKSKKVPASKSLERLVRRALLPVVLTATRRARVPVLPIKRRWLVLKVLCRILRIEQRGYLVEKLMRRELRRAGL